jgi:exopolysaccharide biosynthesis polyprenyl glycosylphosphotransferase
MAILTLRELVAGSEAISAQSIRPWAFATVYLAAGRVALHWSRAQARRHGEALRPTLIVGAGRIGRLTAKRLMEHPEYGLKPIGFLDKEPMDASEHGGVVMPVLGSSWDLDRIVAEHDVQQVIITFSTAPNEVLLRLARRCEELGVGVALVPRLFETVTSKLTVEYLGGLPLLAARASNPRGAQFAVKYAVDRVVAALLIVLSAPLVIAAALGVVVTLGRPVFFRQRRVGRDGREFEMLKFRTMWESERVDATGVELPPDTAPGGVEGIDRRTPFGAFLRRTSIDELPQLLNVLKGEMSLIGPRPERPEFVGLFEQSVYRYGDRHRVKAGITGWSQVNGLRGKTSLADRVEWDNYYIENWSLWLDVKILLLTFVAVLGFSRQVE